MQQSTQWIRRLYTALFALALPFVFLRLLIRSRKQPAYRRRWKERLGFIPSIDTSSIWIHTVSVGETLAAIPLIHALINTFPEHRIFVTTTTPTGSEQVRLKLGDRVAHSYFPYDLPSCIERFLKRSKACLCILLETEIWPNVLTVCQQKKVPALLANARLSEKSMLGYQRLGHMATDMMNLFTMIAAQSQLDADHFIALGTNPNKITITGSIKFDHTPPADITEKATALRSSWHATDRPIWIAGSTRDGEEPMILDAYRHLLKAHHNLLLIIAPRHPNRFETVYQLCKQNGFNTARKSDPKAIEPNTQIIVGNTLGELVLLYATADIAFVGGSLVRVGGHNVLEPAMLGKPVITGPELRNFKVISRLLSNAGGQIIVDSTAALTDTVDMLLKDQQKRETMGEQAKQVVANNVGATQRHIALIRCQFR